MANIACSAIILVVMLLPHSVNTDQTDQHQQTAAQVKQSDEAPRTLSTDITLPFYQSLPKAEPPPGLPRVVGAWLVEIEVTGGLTGSSQSRYIITSEGEVIVYDSRVHRVTTNSNEFINLSNLVKLAQLDKRTTPDADIQKVSLCQECYKTKLRLYRRENDGTTSGYVACWDAVTATMLMKNVADIYESTQRIKNTAEASSKTK